MILRPEAEPGAQPQIFFGYRRGVAPPHSASGEAEGCNDIYPKVVQS